MSPISPDLDLQNPRSLRTRQPLGCQNTVEHHWTFDDIALDITRIQRPTFFSLLLPLPSSTFLILVTAYSFHKSKISQISSPNSFFGPIFQICLAEDSSVTNGSRYTDQHLWCLILVSIDPRCSARVSMSS
jgi:hypothetical protein